MLILQFSKSVTQNISFGGASNLKINSRHKHTNNSAKFKLYVYIITSLFIQLTAQPDCSRNVTTYIKIHIKILLHVSGLQTIIKKLIVVLC